MRLDLHGQRIETDNSGHWLLVLGSLMLFAGAYFAYALLTGSPAANGVMVGDRPAQSSDAWLPVLIAIVGLVIAGYRSRSEIDLGARLRTEHRRFWWSMTTKREPLGEPQRVTLRAESRGSGKNRRTVYAVRLVTSEGEYEVASPGREHRGRAHAETIARMCNVPLHDLRGGTPLVREADELDRSVLDRADARNGPGPVAVPSPCRVRVERNAGRTAIHVPSPAAWLLLIGLVPLLLPVGFFAFFWLPGLTRQSAAVTSTVSWIFWLGVPLVMCLLPMITLMVVAHRSGLVPRRIVVEAGVLRVGRARFPVAGLEELHVATGPLSFWSHLRAASDHTTRRLGRGLSADELRYLRWLILEALRASR